MKRDVVMGLMFTLLLTVPEIGTRSSKPADNTKTGTVEKMVVDPRVAREDDYLTDDVPQVPEIGQETNGNYYDKSLDEHYRERDTGKKDNAPASSARMVPTFIDYSSNNHRLDLDHSDDEKRDADPSNIARSGGRLITVKSDDISRKYYRHKETPVDDVQSRRMSQGQHIIKTQSHDSPLNKKSSVKNVQTKEESHLRDEKYENYDTINEKLSPGAQSSEEMSIDIGREDDQTNLKQKHNLRDSDSNYKFDAMDEGANRNNANVKKDYFDSRFEVKDETDDGEFDQDGLLSRETRKVTNGENYVIDNSNKKFNSKDNEANIKTLSSESDSKNELKRHLHSLSPSEISDLFQTFNAEEKNVVEDLLKEDEEYKIHKRELNNDDQVNSIEIPKLGTDGPLTFQNVQEKDRLDAKTTNEKDSTSTNFNNSNQLDQLLSDSKHENSNNELRTDLINKEKFNPLCGEESENNIKKFHKTTNTETIAKVKINSRRDLKAVGSSESLKINRDSPNIIKSFSLTTLQQEDDTTETTSIIPDTEETRIPTEKINAKYSGSEEVELGNATVVKRDIHNYERTANRYNHLSRSYGESGHDKGYIRALEDSFPRTRESRSRYFDEDQSGLEPLIRVKRASRIGKRHTGLVPETRLAYIPYRSEDDEDTDEGSEFDDDGFDDRTSNLAKRNSYYYDAADDHPRYSRSGSYANDLVSEFNGYDNPREAEYETNQGRAPRYLFSRYKSRIIRGKNPHDRNVYSRGNDDGIVDFKDERNIGSDTDNFLLGVNGADENLMYSGDGWLRRDRRSIRRNKIDNHKEMKRSKLKRNTNMDNMDRDLRNNRKSIVRKENCQGLNSVSTDDKNDLSTKMGKGKDSDVFGGLPLNYRSDLNRFKRIRRTNS